MVLFFQAVSELCFTGPGDRPEAKNIAIVISDGIPFPDELYQPALDEALRLRMEHSESRQHYK